ncbi:MAG TPA: error-prone DNA polymerase [Gammaproteobacteria bacterium]|nr:error-prone DNA polymerase [Gammaproteobacteria bacterium]
MLEYAELHCLSNFTFLRGASHPEELVKRAQELGYRALALTDECSLAGVVRAHVAAQEHHLSLIIGSEFSLANGPKLVLLAANRHGYRSLTRLVTQARSIAPKGQYRLVADDMTREALADCLVLMLSSPESTPGHTPAEYYRTLEQNTGWLGELLPNRIWIGVEQLINGQDSRQLEQLRKISKKTGVPLVASGDVHMHTRTRQRLQDTLNAIRLGITVPQAGHQLYANAERHLRSLQLLERMYPTDILSETAVIAEQCGFSLDEIRYQYPDEFCPDHLNPTAYLRHLVEKGMRQRWPDAISEKIRKQIQHELSLIEELNYEAYFLTVYDIVRFARSRNIFCQGRGSAANSVVCFCLGITEVDPARMEILFERFISRERNEPPDIDIDFEHERREEVMQYVYRKYGREHAALTAAVVTYRPRSAIRDVGKALGLSLDQVDRLARNISWWDDGEITPQRVHQAGFNSKNTLISTALDLASEIIGFPRHLSQHTGGFLISREPLYNLVPVENAAMAKRTVIQWDKNDLDALGLLKVDCLALGMLTAIHRAFDLIQKHQNIALTMSSIPAEDPAVYDMISRADTVGVFQIESRAQMAMLPRLRPACFYDLVIEVAIVRPGPIQGDMVHPYLKRRRGEEPTTYPSEAVRQVLERTLGVPIFQEQVIKLAMVAAGFTPGEADGLRRSMAAWRRQGGLENYEQKLINGMQKRGYDETFARNIYQQILGFGEYGFPESHAASFALLVYISAWLKHHHPAAFTCALLNSQPMGFYAPAQLVQDARRHNVVIQPVDVFSSNWDCTLERKNDQFAIRLGLRMVKGFTRSGAQRLVRLRNQISFQNLHDLSQRGGLSKSDLQALAAANALSSLVNSHRRRAFWAVSGLKDPNPIFQNMQVSEGSPLLRTPSTAEEIQADYSSTGLSLGPHPLVLLRSELDQLGISTSAEIYQKTNGQKAQVAGLVITRQRPASANSVTFVTLEDETGNINLVVWKRLAEKQRRELLGAHLLGAVGEVQRDGDVLHLIAYRLLDHSSLLANLANRSRNFR